MLFMQHYGGEVTHYDEDYFFRDYERQYGKTYLEDFEHIRKLAAPRLARIRRYLTPHRDDSTGAPRLVDLGCAYGPFLAAAKAEGYRALGVDVAEGAVRHVRDKLGIEAHVASLESDDIASLIGTVDVATMWFVIEHFRHLTPILDSVRRMLRPGGIFAFSTPNAAGVSARRDFRDFCRRSPEDHFTLWEPRRCSSILKRFGFRVKEIRITGHHPERFSFVHRGGFAYALADRLSRIAGLGDTFEVYAERI